MNYGLMTAGSAVSVLIIGRILKLILGKIPTQFLRNKFGVLMYGCGCIVTLGLAKWKFSRNFWNSTVEPWIIIFLESLISFGLSEFIRGLRSDNPENQNSAFPGK